MRAHEIVMAWVRDELASGRLSVGDHLPSERVLAERLGVARSSIREAMRVLEALGAIRTATGSGPASGTILTAVPEQALTLSLHLQLATSHVAYQHIYEVRLLLETWAAERAAADHPAWQRAAELLDRMDDPALTIEEFLALDAEFHVTLSHAAENPLISTLMGALRLSIADHTVERARRLPDWERTAQHLRAEHRAILAAAAAGDGAGASRLLTEHIRGYYLESGACLAAE